MSKTTRRTFLGASAALGASALVAPKLALGQAFQKGQTQVWAQLTVGGVAIPPTFHELFTDAMFVNTVIWPLDHPAENFIRLFANADRPQRAGGAGGRGGARGAAPAGAPGQAAPAPGGQPPAGGAPAAGGAPQGGGGRGGGQAAAAAPGVGAGPGGGGGRFNRPPDYPWDPSGGSGDPGWDVLILNDQVEYTEAQRTNIQRAAEAGRGFVVIHHALGNNNTWPWWSQEFTGGLHVLSERDGMKPTTVTPATTLDLKAVGTHPVVSGIGTLRLTNERAYKGMWQSPKITPLLQTGNARSDQTVAWLGVHPTARVVCIQPGAVAETHRHPTYRRLVNNAILWAGKRM